MSFYFEDFLAWKKAFLLTENIYILTRLFPPEEKFVIVDQMRRASVSVMSNIAEGTGRTTNADRNHFYTMARASAFELGSQLLLSDKFGYIHDRKLYDESLILIEEITKILFSFVKS